MPLGSTTYLTLLRRQVGSLFRKLQNFLNRLHIVNSAGPVSAVVLKSLEVCGVGERSKLHSMEHLGVVCSYIFDNPDGIKRYMENCYCEIHDACSFT